MTDDEVQRRVVLKWRTGQITTTEWMHRADPRIRSLLSQIDGMEWVRVERYGDPENREWR